MQMSSKKRIAAIVITTVALSAGTVGVASATTKSKTTATRVSVGNPGARGVDLQAMLTALVAKGTITQGQADAIIAAADAARTAAEAAKSAMPAKPTKADNDARLALIATTIGIDSATVKTRLAAGETLAAIAGAKKDALITALVADETKRSDAAVTAGKLTVIQATTLKAGLVLAVTTAVNSSRLMGLKNGLKGGMDERGGKGEKSGRGHRSKGGPMGVAPKIPAATASASA